MSRRTAGWLAWSLWAAFVVTQTIVVWQVWAGPAAADEAFGLVVIGFATVGALLASRRPDNAVGWLLLATAVAFSLQALGEVYVQRRDNFAFLQVAWVAGWAWYVWVVLTAVFLPLVFPDGRLLSRRWRVVGWLGAAALGASIIGTGFRPGRLDLEADVTNPLGVHGAAGDFVAVVGTVGNVLAGVAAVLSAASLVVRFRRARGVARQQIKWFAFVGLLVVFGLALAIGQVLLPGSWRDPVGAVGWFTFLFACLIGLPAAVGIAVFKHRLYDIDLVIKRTLVYGSLTALLLVTYLVLVLVFRLVLSPVTGDSDLAVAGSTLAVAALFRPLRSRIQAVVNRRFYRERYDAARTLEGFAGRLRDELDLETLGVDLRAVVRETMAPAHVSLWLRGAP